GPKTQAGIHNSANRPGGFYPDTPSTTGWQPTCDCDAGDPVPAVVLDPFLGSGTTAMVAQQLGRRAIGIDLKADYLDMAIRRCGQKTLWFSAAG
ncbi:MAG TPA: DNA methyltransferase, partial [Guyparkeria sp.]|nr:DNA methyltransferase [Guyparkeria sp.]